MMCEGFGFSETQLTPEQFGPGLVSTSCISLEDTSAVLADELSEVRIAADSAVAVRNTTCLVVVCCILSFSLARPLKMDKTP